LQQFEVELTDPEAPKPQQLVTEEERERGTVNLGVYWSYLTAVYQGALIVIIVIMQVCFQVLQIAGNYWMAWASPTTSGGKSHVSSRKLILVYVGLVFGSTIFVIIRSLLVELVGLLAAQKYFKGMVRCIFRAPMSFFDSTPTGRILNRSSSDQSDIDWEIQYKFGGLMVTTIQLLGTITVMSQVGWEVLLLFLPVFIACIFMQRYYMKSARELQRVKSIQQSPIIHHYGESITGAATIRGFGQEQRFMDTIINLCDKYMRPSFYTLATTQWLVFRMELLSTFIFASLMILVVLLPPSNLYSGLIGLAVIYGLSLNIQQSQWVWCLCEVENTIIAVERVQQYMGIPSEAPLLIQESRPPRDWPTSGTIQLQDLQVPFQPKVPKNSSVLPVSSTIEKEILSCFCNTCVIVNSVLGV
jgi:ABC-type multidrug transport system fused ATPase/permease subunit